ncbi:Glycolate utilization operon transcriptional activator GlcC [Paramagnetospirillum magnetotacticum MS-1]|uniref:Glycolate utilization operon transcriptional activator GlcC n=1 Tax=Paramagnetospirillum magnetotacticum MS-1 TaxID=272627 RepID=A0A0C2YS26_PARME|nr:FCD domain-containing protein [Paramagnetospirillum magnetotacticum]KIL97505.1 Glycolate utilization operon transcriptional activator GlcC [Paramagnetospirillum magnetotacticum MS-1]
MQAYPDPMMHAAPKPTLRNAGEPASDPLSRLLQAHPETVFDYFEFRRVMAGSAAALAAERATPEDLAHLRACMEAMEKAHALDDPAQEAATDAEFHLAIYQSAHNLVMSQVMGRVFDMLKVGVFYDRIDLYRRRGVRDAFLRQHQAIWQAIVAGNPEAARIAAEAHINSTEEALREAQFANSRRDVALRRRAGSDLTGRPR